METNISKESKKIWIIALVAAALVIALILGNYLLFINSKDRGINGDMFGAANALFSGLAFAGIILTIYMQKHELELQRLELKGTRDVFEKQAQIMRDQQNDNTFFNLLSNHRQLVESFMTGKSRKVGKPNLFSRYDNNVLEVVSGYEVLKKIVEQWVEYFSNYSSMYISGIISDFGEGTYDPIQIIKNNIEAETLFIELLHIYQFIDSRFKEQAFYKDTLWNNISFHEKIIFETALVNKCTPELQYNHQIELYNQYGFVDFTKCKLPETEVFLDKGSNSPHLLKIICEGELVAYNIIVYKKIYSNDSIEIVGNTDIKKELNVDMAEMELEKCLRLIKLSSGEDLFPNFENVGDFLFAINYKVNMNDKYFDIIFGTELVPKSVYNSIDKDFDSFYCQGLRKLDSNVTSMLLSEPLN